MAKLHIIKKGDPLLRKISRPVTEITPRILTLLDDMAETMHAADGCGLAAVQVGRASPRCDHRGRAGQAVGTD